MDEEFCEIKTFLEGFCSISFCVEDSQCYLFCSVSVYRVFFVDGLVTAFPRVVVGNSKGWGGCRLKRSALLHLKVGLVFL